MPITIKGAAEHNLRNIDIEIPDGLTAVTGVSGSGKSSLAFDTLYHEARRRFLDIFTLQSSSLRLNPAHVETIEGLLPAVSVAQNVLNRNPNSTVATATGIHPFLRLLYSHYGTRRCPRCGEPVAALTDDEVADHLVRDGATGQSQLFLPLVRGVAGSHGTLLEALSDEFGAENIFVDQSVYGSSVLDGNSEHDIELRVVVRPVTVPEARELIADARGLGSSFIRSRSGVMAIAPVCYGCGESIHNLNQKAFHQHCPHCSGEGCARCSETGLHPDAAATRWEGLRIDEILALNVSAFLELLGKVVGAGGSARLIDEIMKRARSVDELGLGYLALSRSSPTLSRGEAQRLRLSVCLASKLEMLHVLDEPSIGLHPTDVGTLFSALRKLSGPVVYVEHERGAVAAADHCIDIGPEAGSSGGKLVYEGTPAGLWESDSFTGRFFGLHERVERPGRRAESAQHIVVEGAQINNLQGIDVRIPTGAVTVVTGVSGSGKTSLVQGVVAASYGAGKPINCDAITLGPMKCVHVDQNPIGINPRSNPATYTKLSDVIRDLFAAQTGLSASSFSFNRKEGACETCSGLGAEEIRMRYLPSSWVPCPACEGRRFSDEVLGVAVDFGGRKLTIADIYELCIDEVADLVTARLNEDPNLVSASKRRQAVSVLQALRDIGLGYLPLGQPSPTLSGGEAQRIKLTRYLGRRNLDDQLLILDEPSTGLHPADVAGLLEILDRLARRGTTLLVVEHNQDIIRAADWVIDLGPGAGPDGGAVVYQGDVDGLESCEPSRTAKGLREEGEIVPRRHPVQRDAQTASAIRIHGASLNNLKSVDVEISKGELTVVTGVSGSGKSSLVSGVLEGEARRRYLETLSMYERESVRDSGTWAESDIDGLGVTVAVNPNRGRYNLRSTVGTTSEIVHRLAVLYAESRERICLSCGGPMAREEKWHCPACGDTAPILGTRRFFRNTYASACRNCHGVGSLRSFILDKLIIRPDLPLCSGAMHSPGFFPKGYLCKPFNGGYDEVQALARKYEFDPETTPWNAMSDKAQHVFIYGDDEPLEVIHRSRSGRVSTSVGPFHGFFHWIGDWDLGGTYTDTEECPQCGGSGLRPESLAVRLAGKSIHELCELPLATLAALMKEVTLPADATRSLKTVHATALNRIDFLTRSGLGYVHLNRLDATLSAGEAQRVKLAGLMGSGLTGMTILLDEPSRGMHPRELESLAAVVCELRDEGNTVVVVEHDPLFMRAADAIIDMGPGAGSRGGEVLYSGPLSGLLRHPGKSETGRWLAGTAAAMIRAERRTPSDWLILESPSENNLQGEDVRFPLGVVAGVCGVSGSGKSTLVVDTLGRILAPAKQTTSVAYEPIEPGAHARLRDPPRRTVIIDQARSGVKSPGVFLGLERVFATRYAESADAADLEYGHQAFTRTCSRCAGAGRIRLEMGFLPDIYSECDLCDGTGYPPEANDVRLRGLTMPEISGATLEDIYELWNDDPKIGPLLSEAVTLGLGYLVFHQPAHTLSGGEAQRLKIIRELVKKRRGGTLYILDEPTVGQHLSDVSRLSDTLHRLVEEGESVLVVEHHAHLLGACDWLIELGPGSGPEGGRIVAQGTPEELARGDSATAPYLREVLGKRPG